MSHSYSDANELAEARRRLPKNVELLIHPPIKVTPKEFVSDSLVAMMERAASGLIVDGPGARKSFWVAYERDFMARSGKPLFQLNASRIVPHKVEVSRLPVFLFYERRDRDRAQEITAWFREKRNFDLWMDVYRSTTGGRRTGIRMGERWQEAENEALSDRLTNGYALCLLSSNFFESDRLVQQVKEAMGRSPNRVLPVFIESEWALRYERCPEFLKRIQIRNLTAGVGEGLNANLLDDLMVDLLGNIYAQEGQLGM